MSSIRLFVLSSFDALGPMHGHRLRLEAERNHVAMWTDISVGAVYGAMSRLATEGLLREAGQERDGNRPVRQLYEITDEGRAALAELRRTGLTEVWFKHDPFDLALTRFDRADVAELPGLLRARLAVLEARLAETVRTNAWADPHIGVTKRWVLKHSERRLNAEVDYLRELLADIDAVVADIGSGQLLRKTDDAG